MTNHYSHTEVFVQRRHHRCRGFTVLEVVISLAIVVVLATVIVSVFSAFNRAQSLDGATEVVVSLVQEARTLTLASREGMVYGIHFATTSVTLFAGSVYTEGASENDVYELSDAIEISAITLSGGGSDVVFERLSGKTDESGTVTLSAVADPNRSRTITIDPTGLVSAK